MFYSKSWQHLLISVAKLEICQPVIFLTKITARQVVNWVKFYNYLVSFLMNIQTKGHSVVEGSDRRNTFTWSRDLIPEYFRQINHQLCQLCSRIFRLLAAMKDALIFSSVVTPFDNFLLVENLSRAATLRRLWKDFQNAVFCRQVSTTIKTELPSRPY